MVRHIILVSERIFLSGGFEGQKGKFPIFTYCCADDSYLTKVLESVQQISAGSCNTAAALSCSCHRPVEAEWNDSCLFCNQKHKCCSEMWVVTGRQRWKRESESWREENVNRTLFFFFYFASIFHELKSKTWEFFFSMHTKGFFSPHNHVSDHFCFATIINPTDRCGPLRCWITKH